MKQIFISLLAASGLALATSQAQAQTTFGIGPKIGYTLSSASFTVADYPDYFSTPSTYGSGFEAGVVAQVGFGNHFALQPAVLYTRKAPGYGTSSYYQPNNYSYKQEYALKLNYITVPVNLLYSQRPNGRGGQVFVGPYVGWLLGGTYTSSTGSGRGTSVSGGATSSGDVKPGDTYSKNSTYYIRQLDAGAQIGVGYGFAALQVQASFSLGLHNIGAAYAPNAGNPYEAPVIRNRGFQVSAAYLFGPRN
ncbi:porin family protein [Hymenobacter nivis]|nr:porin family protein [Hymenobacter nivis]